LHHLPTMRRYILGVMVAGLAHACGLAQSADAGGDVRTCGGVAVSCESWGGICSLQLGCHDDSVCMGTARACSAFDTNMSCLTQPGCRWQLTGVCDGTVTPCDDPAGFCEQLGCTSRSTCSGTAADCSTFGWADCANQAGCMLH